MGKTAFNIKAVFIVGGLLLTASLVTWSLREQSFTDVPDETHGLPADDKRGFGNRQHVPAREASVPSVAVKLRVHVVAANGYDPVIGVTVRVNDREEVTDAEGDSTFDIEPGFHEVYLGGVWMRSVHIVQSASIELKYSSSSVAAIMGHVVDVAGNPVAQAGIRLEGISKGSVSPVLTHSRSDGSFAIQGLPARAGIFASKEGYGDSLSFDTSTLESRRYDAGVVLTLLPTRSGAVDVFVQNESGVGIGGAAVRIITESVIVHTSQGYQTRRKVFTNTTDAQGIARFRQLPLGPADLGIEPPPQWALVAQELSITNRLESHVVRLMRGSSQMRQLLDQEGRPMAHCRVSQDWPNACIQREWYTDKDGYVRIDGVAWKSRYTNEGRVVKDLVLHVEKNGQKWTAFMEPTDGDVGTIVVPTGKRFEAKVEAGEEPAWRGTIDLSYDGKRVETSVELGDSGVMNAYDRNEPLVVLHARARDILGTQHTWHLTEAERNRGVVLLRMPQVGSSVAHGRVKGVRCATVSFVNAESSEGIMVQTEQDGQFRVRIVPGTYFVCVSDLETGQYRWLDAGRTLSLNEDSHIRPAKLVLEDGEESLGDWIWVAPPPARIVVRVVMDYGEDLAIVEVTRDEKMVRRVPVVDGVPSIVNIERDGSYEIAVKDKPDRRRKISVVSGAEVQVIL